MHLAPRHAVFLSDLAERRPAFKQRSLLAEEIQREFALGITRASKIYYGEQDYSRAAKILQELGITGLRPETASRRDRAGFGALSEKFRARAVSKDFVAVRPVSAGVVLEGRELVLPAEGFLTVRLDTVLSAGASTLLLVENLESFVRVGLQDWLGAPPATLAIWRGGTLHSPGAVNRLLEQSTLPVWAWFDFDPAGLEMASRLPRLAHLVVPSETQIENLERARHGNRSRFAEQLKQSAGTLERCEHPEVRKAWQRLKRLGRAYAQELVTV
jgi:hypothetical protein